jgi:YggT family protein
MISALIQFLDALIGVAIWLIIIDVVMQLLVQFNLLNSSSSAGAPAGGGLRELTWYFYRPFRWVIARLVGHQPMLDLSPLLAILALQFLRNLLIGLLAG